MDDDDARRKKGCKGGIPRANKASEHRSSKELLQDGFVFPLLQVKGGNKGRAVIIVALWNIPPNTYLYSTDNRIIHGDLETGEALVVEGWWRAAKVLQSHAKSPMFLFSKAWRGEENPGR